MHKNGIEKGKQRRECCKALYGVIVSYMKSIPSLMGFNCGDFVDVRKLRKGVFITLFSA